MVHQSVCGGSASSLERDIVFLEKSIPYSQCAEKLSTFQGVALHLSDRRLSLHAFFSI